MSSSNENNWLSNYYNRIVTDCTISFERRDRITNWSYAIIAAVMAAYASLFVEVSDVAHLARFGLVAGALFILIRFFFQSMVAYGYFLRGRHLRTRIEEYWFSGKPSLEEIKNDVITFDHGKKVPNTNRNRLIGQLRSGSLLILAIPTVPLIIELHRDLSWQYYLIVGLLIAYLIFEIYNFKSYDQTKGITKTP